MSTSLQSELQRGRKESSLTKQKHCIYLYPLRVEPALLLKVVDIVRTLSSRDIDRSVKSLALHVYAECNTTVNVVPGVYCKS